MDQNDKKEPDDTTIPRKSVLAKMTITPVKTSHWIGGNLKLLRESTNADRKRLKKVFSIANCRFRLPICNLKHCFNAYPSALLDFRDSSRLPPIRCEHERWKIKQEAHMIYK